MELGLGIHGEPGFEKITFDKISKVIPKMFDKLLDFSADYNYLGYLKDKTDIAILINNLGTVTPIEMNVITKYTIKEIKKNKYLSQCLVKKLFVGPFMTSLDMQGFSISILKVNKDILTALEFPVDCIAWIPGNNINITALKNMDSKTDESKDNNTMDETMKLGNGEGCILSNDRFNIVIKSIINGCNNIIKNKDLLNKMDTIVGDGDCGVTFSIGSNLIISQLKDNSNIAKYKNTMSLLLFDIGNIIAYKMGGSSGAIFGYLLVSLSQSLKALTKDKLNGSEISKSFKNTLNETSQFCGATKGDRTLMDTFIAFVDSLTDGFTNNPSKSKEVLTNALKNASKSCIDTQGLPPKFGRASYLPKRVWSTCQDPGAKGVLLFLEAFVETFL